MKTNKKQKGYTFIGAILTIAISLAIIVLGVKIAGGYIEAKTIKTAIKRELQEEAQSQYGDINTRQMKLNIIKNLYMTDIELTENDILITKKGKEIDITIPRIKEIKLWDNAKLVIDFTVEEKTTQ